ncbi:MAG: hypothetical protein ACLSHV_03420 [Hominisplanchenecus sp.]
MAINYSHRNKNVRLYELANIYLPKALPLTELPDERMQFTLGMYGSGDFFDDEGCRGRVPGKSRHHLKITHYDPNSRKDHSCIRAVRQTFIYDGEVIGFLGEVHPTRLLATYGIGEKAYVAVLDMPKIVANATFDRKYAGHCRNSRQ